MDSTLIEKVEWLTDRALISDLLHSFANALDTKDVDAYINNYTEDGQLELPNPESPKKSIQVHRKEMKNFVSKGLMTRYQATHHISTNHQIQISGNTASSKSYLQAVHVRDNPSDHWDVGGWYECRYLRVDQGWKFLHVKLTAVWLSGTVGSIKPNV